MKLRWRHSKKPCGGHFMPRDMHSVSVILSIVKVASTHRAKFIAQLILLLAVVIPARGQQPAWRPGKAPLLTRWAAQVNPTNALPEYPRPQLVRGDWLNLNGLWDYAITPSLSNPLANFQGQILVPFPIDSALSGVMQRLEETNALWYRRRVTMPKSWQGKHVRLHFGAVDWQARAMVNGKSVGQHRGGYDRFSFDITDQLRWSGEEEIIVAVTDPTEGDQPRGKQSRKPEGIFYTATSGIWQTVWLEPVPEICIDRLKVEPDLDSKSLHLWVAANSFAENLHVEITAFAGSNTVARVTGPANS